MPSTRQRGLSGWSAAKWRRAFSAPTAAMRKDLSPGPSSRRAMDIDFVFLVAVLGGSERGLLRALPAVHRLAKDRGALGLREDALLPGGGACPAFLDLAKVAADDAAVLSQLVGNLLVGKSFDVETLDVGAEPRQVRGGEFFIDFDFAHFSRGIRGFCKSGLDQTSIRRGSERDQDSVRPRSGLRPLGCRSEALLSMLGDVHICSSYLRPRRPRAGGAMFGHYWDAPMANLRGAVPPPGLRPGRRDARGMGKRGLDRWR